MDGFLAVTVIFSMGHTKCKTPNNDKNSIRQFLHVNTFLKIKNDVIGPKANETRCHMTGSKRNTLPVLDFGQMTSLPVLLPAIKRRTSSCAFVCFGMHLFAWI